MANASDSADSDPRLRALPSVSALLQRPAALRMTEAHGHAVVVLAIRDVVAHTRLALLADSPGRTAEIDDAAIEARVRVLAAGTLVPVINATGVVVHTNLGRAPLAPEALEAIVRVAQGYTTLEYDLAKGLRGDRHAHAVRLLTELTHAEDALVVNNNAAALLLALSALARGKEVIVSRGELVEIGGGFRIPDVLAQSGARLVEVGTTNRTHPDDYARAITPDTALLLKVHRSNFAVVGFTCEVDIPTLSKLARDRGVPLLYDAGSGCLVDPIEGGSGEPTVASHVQAGADVVTFSGDKLLGGPQSGILVGKRALLDPMRKNPWMRAVRPDKTCLAALCATLALWQKDPMRVPVARMMATSIAELTTRAARIAAAVDGTVVPSSGRIGGGAAPTSELEGRAVRIDVPKPSVLAGLLREGDPPIVSRIEDDAVLLDLRCVHPDDDEAVVREVSRALSRYAAHA